MDNRAREDRCLITSFLAWMTMEGVVLCRKEIVKEPVMLGGGDVLQLRIDFIKRLYPDFKEVR